MSSPRRSQKRRSRFPWVPVIFGGVLLGAAAIIMLARQGEGGGTPIVTVAPELIDYGDVKLDTPLKFEITVRNAGSGTLRLTGEPYIEVLEGC